MEKDVILLANPKGKTTLIFIFCSFAAVIFHLCGRTLQALILKTQVGHLSSKTKHSGVIQTVTCMTYNVVR